MSDELNVEKIYDAKVTGKERYWLTFKNIVSKILTTPLKRKREVVCVC